MRVLILIGKAAQTDKGSIGFFLDTATIMATHEVDSVCLTTAFQGTSGNFKCFQLKTQVSSMRPDSFLALYILDDAAVVAAESRL